MSTAGSAGERPSAGGSESGGSAGAVSRAGAGGGSAGESHAGAAATRAGAGGSSSGGSNSGGAGGAGSSARGGASGAATGGTVAEPEFHDLRGTLDGAPVDLQHTDISRLGEEDTGEFWAKTSLGEADSLLYVAGVDLAVDRETPLRHVVFRMPDRGPHAGTFFCAGDGSVVHAGKEALSITLRSLSRLGACAEFAGTDTLRASIGGDKVATGTVRGAPYDRVTGGNSFLRAGDRLWIGTVHLVNRPSGEALADYPQGGFAFRVTSSPSSGDPVLTSHAHLFETRGAEPLIVCGGPDSNYVRSAGADTAAVLELRNATALPACPGTPIDGELTLVNEVH